MYRRLLIVSHSIISHLHKVITTSYYVIGSGYLVFVGMLVGMLVDNGTLEFGDSFLMTGHVSICVYMKHKQ